MEFSVSIKKPHDKWIYSLCLNKHNLSQFLNHYRFVQPPQCSSCKQTTVPKLLTNNRDLQRNRLPYAWSCSSCQTSQVFTTNTYFLGCHLSLADHVGLLYKFVLKQNAAEAANELNIGYNAARLYYAFFRECIHDYVQKDFYPNFKFDTQYAIEWDEASLPKKQKHHTGNYNAPQWVLGGIQRKTGYICLEHVKERDAQTLQSYIEAHADEDGLHVTDGWKGYHGLNKRGFYHFNVSHKDGFVHPMTKAHTNTIEGAWSLIRYDLRRYRGIKPGELQKYLDEVAFRKNMKLTKEGTWHNLLLVIATKQHSIPQPKYT